MSCKSENSDKARLLHLVSFCARFNTQLHSYNILFQHFMRKYQTDKTREEKETGKKIKERRNLTHSVCEKFTSSEHLESRRLFKGFFCSTENRTCASKRNEHFQG
ncbi:hypothetical protein CEXT_682561 [Caerostris extrusa]|uniref:Uncharacterized protein n=1 Tax=Caerostris extrusa TaxID=172846 RepID=A0AAV4SXE8_CAEEX|nr:hypothetical protein CEXT_682561 [Caerostris extrusa]